jgi:predicted permease
MSFLQDARHSIRLLARSPIFTLTSVLSLAIGIAATAAIFSMADALWFRARVGVAHPETLVEIGRSMQGSGFDNFGYPLFERLRDGSKLFDGMAAAQLAPNVMALGDASSSERAFTMLVSGTYFDVIGARAARGRFFLPEEDRTPGTHPVVVLSHHFWTRRYNADPAVVGQTVRLNNLPYTVIGVAEEGFTGTSILTTDMWAPMAMEAHVRAGDQPLLTEHNAVWHTAIGRLRDGATPQQAREELTAIARAYFTERGDKNRLERWGINVVVSSRVPAPVQTIAMGFIGMLGALTGLVLLIACTNVAAMLLARALERRREIATRLAIGASRSRVLAQLLTEGLALALVAGLVSLPITAALVTLLSSYQPSLPLPLGLELRIDPRVMGFAFVLSALAAMVFALMPAVQATRLDVAPALHGQNSTLDRRRVWLRQSLVAAQVAMALLLLVAAGLFLRSLQEAGQIDLGYKVEQVDLLTIDTRVGGYRTDAEGMAAVERLLERFRAIPGVAAVGAARMVPLYMGRLGLGGLRAPGYKGPDGTDATDADWDAVTVGYFDAVRLPITRGRAFDARDRDGSTRVAIINETMAAELWPGQDPIGRQLYHQAGPPGTTKEQPLEIVGVARDAKNGSLSDVRRNFIYVPTLQQYLSEVTFFVRRTASGSRLAELRQAVIAFDPNLPVIFTQTFDQATALALLPQRLAAWIATTVGTIGLLLAALGLYGLTAFSVAQRSREIAVRVALGATRRSVMSLVLGQSSRLALIGTLAGLALAIGASQLLASLLVGISTVDPMAFAAPLAVMIAVLLIATWTPARRAANSDPMRALRAE